MSVIYIWDSAGHKLPTNDDEAKKLCKQLIKGRQGTLSGKFTQLAQHIQAWLESNPDVSYSMVAILTHTTELIEQNSTDVLSILLQEDATEILRQLVSAAKACDLVLMYDKFPMLFLPDGQLFPEDGTFVSSSNKVVSINAAAMWDAVTERIDDPKRPFPRTLIQLNRLLLERLTILAVQYGMRITTLPWYKYTKYAFVRDIETGQQYFSWDLTGDLEEYEVSIELYFINRQVMDIYNQFDFSKTSYTYLKNVPNSMNRKYRSQFKQVVHEYGEITNHQEFEAALTFFEKFAFKEILEVAVDIKGLDYLLNGVGEDHVLNANKPSLGFRSPQNVIIARLANNPNFEQLVMQCEAQQPWDWGINESVCKTEFPKLVNYLRHEVKPLV